MENVNAIENLNNWNSEISNEADFFDKVSMTPTDSKVTEETISGNESLTDDLVSYNESKIASMKEQLFERVFENELVAFYQENHRFANHSERKLISRTVEKMIGKGQIYINEIGKIVVRKGSNKTNPTKKRKKRK